MCSELPAAQRRKGHGPFRQHEGALPPHTCGWRPARWAGALRLSPSGAQATRRHIVRAARGARWAALLAGQACLGQMPQACLAGGQKPHWGCGPSGASPGGEKPQLGNCPGGQYASRGDARMGHSGRQLAAGGNPARDQKTPGPGNAGPAG